MFRTGVYQAKYYYGSVKNSKCSFICHFEINKKINNVSKKNPRRKADTNFDLFQAAYVLMRL